MRPEPVVGITPARLAALHPRLFHVAAGGSWPSLRRHGLLPTSRLVETSGLDPEQRAALLRRRTRSTPLVHPLYGAVTIRDQLPLRPGVLGPKLTDVTFEEWLAVLNERVFLWLHPRKLAGLLNARVCRGRPHDVITVDTASLLSAHLDDVRLSPINSGSALYPNAATRGSATFARLADYPYEERRRARSAPDAIAELAVIGGVPDLAAHVVGVDRYVGADFAAHLVGTSRPVRAGAGKSGSRGSGRPSLRIWVGVGGAGTRESSASVLDRPGRPSGVSVS